jgi:hypothetical protein
MCLVWKLFAPAMFVFMCSCVCIPSYCWPLLSPYFQLQLFSNFANEVTSGAGVAPSGKLHEAEGKNKEHSVLTYNLTLNLIFIKAGGKNQEIYEHSMLLTWGRAGEGKVNNLSPSFCVTTLCQLFGVNSEKKPSTRNGVEFSKLVLS